ncbi:GNAT family N-acetyltransferase [Candidatus Micrarchaeota archaeon]|nr:GNAT family N-acetyltransferase [Candidatus Micrarchaeota archaeon]
MKIRLFRIRDALKLSKCIVTTLRKSNSEFYPKKVIEYIAKEYSSANIKKRAKGRTTLVAQELEEIIGTISITDNGWINAMFVLPSKQKKGIGSRLLKDAEKRARKKGFAALRTHCAINAVNFYKKHGYRIIRKVVFEKAGETYRLFKRL